MKLRPYQIEAKQGVYAEWSKGNKNTCLVMPTGAGKTATSASIIHDHAGASCVIAHRQELVSQLSVALAREGVPHQIIAPPKVIKLCAALHLDEVGKSFVVANSKCAVAGVDTLIRRTDDLRRWANTVTLWVTDESHHLLPDNKWGKAIEMFPNAKGLGVTATPMRADGKGLDGVFNALVLGPTMADLIGWGFLTKYRVFAPPSDLNLEGVAVSKTTGDYNHDGLVKATRRSHITGDVVAHYLRIARGQRGVTFATDVETSKEIARQFNEAGVPALALDAKTPDVERVDALKRFKRGEIMQIVNVDLFGEGFDLPAISVVSFARATASYGLYVQMFGRALRLMEGKEYAIIIDHVGNVIRHGLPDAPRKWSLEGRGESGKATSDAIPVKSCPQCTAVYERIWKECPDCGFVAEPAKRSAPEYVDGDLYELDADTLARLRGAVEEVDKPIEVVRAELAAKYVPQLGILAGVKRHRVRQEAQGVLRGTIAQWMGYRKAEGDDISTAQRRFYHKFGVDVMTAQTLGEKEAKELDDEIRKYM